MLDCIVCSSPASLIVGICDCRIRSTMVSRSAPALCALALFLGLFLDQCSCQAVPQTVVLGGDTGWTDGANVNYTQFMASVLFKAGDSLRFNNTDIEDHNVLQVYSQADFDACNSNNNTGWVVNAGDSYDLPFPDPAYRVWIIDPTYCLIGQNVEFTVLNEDGTAVPPDTGADPPSLNAPPVFDGSPPSPPTPPLSVAGGPTPNSASASQARLAIVMLVSSACFLVI